MQCGTQIMSTACVVPVCQRVLLSQSVSSEATGPAVCYGHPSVCAGWFYCRAVGSFFLHLLIPMLQLVGKPFTVFVTPVTEQRRSLLNAAIFVLPSFQRVNLYGRLVLPKCPAQRVEMSGISWGNTLWASKKKKQQPSSSEVHEQTSICVILAYVAYCKHMLHTVCICSKMTICKRALGTR